MLLTLSFNSQIFVQFFLKTCKALEAVKREVESTVADGKLPFLGVIASVDGKEIVNTFSGNAR